MAIFEIESLVPTNGPCPTNQYDPDSSLSLIEWMPGDQAVLTFRIPHGFTVDSKMTLIFDEQVSTPGSVYSWDISITLIRPSVSTPDTGLWSGIVSSEFTSSAPVGSIVTHTITDLMVGAFPVPGDIISLRLEYSCPEAPHCPEKLRTLAYRIEVSTEQASENSNCIGRVADIIRDTRDLFNEETGAFLSDPFILRSINGCLKDLARENYWSGERWITAHSGETSIDLLKAIPDLQDVHRVQFSGQPELMRELHALDEYLEICALGPNVGVPAYYLIRNNLMQVWPAPVTDLASGYHVHYSRLPSPLGCSESNCDPPVPRAHDTIFSLFALRQAFLRDRSSSGADLKFREYSQLYEAEKRRLLDAGGPVSVRARVGR